MKKTSPDAGNPTDAAANKRLCAFHLIAALVGVLLDVVRIGLRVAEEHVINLPAALARSARTTMPLAANLSSLVVDEYGRTPRAAPSPEAPSRADPRAAASRISVGMLARPSVANGHLLNSISPLSSGR